MKVTKDTIIVSLTSWPKRIKFVPKVLYSLLNQNIDKSKYHIVLVLAEPEFPNLENDLPSDLRLFLDNDLIEIIWYKHNILSHKKLMPTLAKYPDNAIIVTDDDILRPKDWLATFITDYEKYPNDILVGACVFGIEFNNEKFNPCKKIRYDDISLYGKIITNRRPANGFGGVLYPPHTFNDERFYDEALMMKLSEYSDESWQFCFNIIENKTLRYISKFGKFHEYLLPDIFESSMSKIRLSNKSKWYDVIFENLFKEFPEFEKKLREKLK